MQLKQPFQINDEGNQQTIIDRRIHKTFKRLIIYIKRFSETS